MTPESVGEGLVPKAPFRLPATAHRTKNGVRDAYAEHREGQRQRAAEASTLAETYPQLKSLQVNLEFVNRDGLTKTSYMKYSANPEYAKSVLVFACPDPECVGGDFDLTAKLAEAVAKRRKQATGNIFCLGSHKRASGQLESCRSELHYTLNLGYAKRGI